jgi:hypothetical protein
MSDDSGEKAAEGPTMTPNMTPRMTIEEFKATVARAAPPAGISAALVAMWQDARGGWDVAHQIAQDIPETDKTGAWIHDYLHRKEGDLANAGYWYRRAGKPVAHDSLEDEWTRIVTALL